MNINYCNTFNMDVYDIGFSTLCVAVSKTATSHIGFLINGTYFKDNYQQKHSEIYMWNIITKKQIHVTKKRFLKFKDVIDNMIILYNLVSIPEKVVQPIHLEIIELYRQRKHAFGGYPFGSYSYQKTNINRRIYDEIYKAWRISDKCNFEIANSYFSTIVDKDFLKLLRTQSHSKVMHTLLEYEKCSNKK